MNKDNFDKLQKVPAPDIPNLTRLLGGKRTISEFQHVEIKTKSTHLITKKS
ncbi:hypothetical protein [Providencia sp. PROV077]|uniref:hypothetical protein n=1 Tax=Providencia sp. PROV077 TaxID=2949799 RepID=UPI00234AD35F|nr:hypothetical protein [Providencia sp. PROV077]